MTTLKTASAPAEPGGRIAPLVPYSTPLRIAGGVLVIIGALLPWATFVLNKGAYPEKATLEYFSAPLGATAGGLEHAPKITWRLNTWVERLLLLVTFALLLLLVSAVLTSGGQGSAANVYAGPVFLSFLGAAGG